eukprot:m.313134 g.313134  ORF g.313134 m.313134 type:complete len:90 (+) comp352538_c0_seq1:137-406(+)
MRSIERDMRNLERVCSTIGAVNFLPAKSIYHAHAVQPTIAGIGLKKFHWSFDVSGFNPENVSIRTQGGKLEVKAKHEEKSEHHQHFDDS